MNAGSGKIIKFLPCRLNPVQAVLLGLILISVGSTLVQADVYGTPLQSSGISPDQIVVHPSTVEVAEEARKHLPPISKEKTKKLVNQLIAVINHDDLMDLPFLERTFGEKFTVFHPDVDPPDQEALWINNSGRYGDRLNVSIRKYRPEEIGIVLPNGIQVHELADSNFYLRLDEPDVCMRAQDLNRYFGSPPIDDGAHIVPAHMYYPLKHVSKHNYRVFFERPFGRGCIAPYVYQEIAK